MIILGKTVVKYRVLILILAVLLLVPSLIGIFHTRINYDMLNYLPDDMDTASGQKILLNDFGKGAFSFIIVEGMENKDVVSLKSELQKVNHVESVIWYDNLLDISVPMEMLPDEIYNAFNSGDSTLLAVFFDTSTSADETINAIQNIRKIANEKCFVTGMSALVADLKELCEKEEPIYVGLAVLLACAAMMLFMDSWIIPIIFLADIGAAIVYNLGSNYFLGEISYITKALSAVIQLAVTMDYSIFLWHSYSEQKIRYNGDRNRAMAEAISESITAVLGSSLTTIAGFLALCFMTFTLGKDLGIVMGKGVLLGLIACVTVLPALILVFDKLIEKTKHRSLIPDMKKTAVFITKHAWVFLLIFVLLIVPAYYGYSKTNDGVYYNIGSSLPKDMDFIIANSKLKDTFDIGSTHMVMADAKLSPKDIKSMMSEIEDVKGVKCVLGMESVVGSLVPEDVIPNSIKNVLESDKWELILINSEYTPASDDVNNQIDKLNNILKKYDKNGMLIGEASCTKDMIEVTDKDFQVVNIISIAAIFLIIAIVLKSASLPVILVAIIEFAVSVNLGLPYYLGTTLPFIAPICISTIQLGSTVDYAILMTSKYKSERSSGHDKRISTINALSSSIPSIVVSAAGLFAATFGVGLYSDIDIISSMCNLLARGAVISMLSVIFILPAMFLLFDKLICNTSIGFRSKTIRKEAELS